MKIVRYFMVGSCAFIVDIGIFSLGVKVLLLDWFIVAPVSFLLATIVNFALSILYVFQSGIRFKRGMEVTLVFLVSGIGLVVNQSVLWLLIDLANFDEVSSKVLASGTVFLWNYMSRSRYIFRAPV